MNHPSEDKKTNIILAALGVIPVVWAALMVAPFLSDGLAGIIEGFTSGMADPMKVKWCVDSLKAILIFLLIYGLSIGVYLSTKRNYRKGEEHGSAKWGNASQLSKKYADKNKYENIILTQNTRIGLDGRKHRRNLNVLVCGGSGAGKTRFYAKPNIMQANTSFVVLDPKGEILRDTGFMLEKEGYEIRVLDLINTERSHGYNPFVYLRDDKDILKLVANLVRNTTPKGAQSNDPFWERAETALLEALILYLVNEAPPEEQNFPMVMEMISAAEVKEEDEGYTSILDELFNALELRNPDHLALKQYRIFKMAAGVVCSKRLLNQAVGKSLRTHNLKPKKGAQVMRKNEKITALYERLSRDDFGKDDDQQRESNSISNQKKILQRYALDHGYKNYRFYIDDGISGTTFNRPGFQQMIADIEAGLVNRVIIKDMSRLGRDYLQVGMYTEIMFPEHDIHFIAVNDGVDSTQGDNEFTPFRNIINEWYAKDTSKKIRAVMKVKGNAGEHLTTLPPYGYMKAPDNKKLWVRDEEAAAVVYEIGLYVMDGFGPSQIARKLTERRILTPAAYYASRGRKASNIKRGLPYAWDASTVADIMDRWREYLGHTVNFKTRKKSYKSKKVIHNPESEWMIFENTHDPIWTEAIADAARAARQTRRRPTKMGEMGMFSGMMFCADCGSVMYQCRATNFRREQEYYLCAGYRKSRDFCGQTHSIRTVILEELILENLREIVSFASRSKDEFVRLVMDSDLRQRDRDLAKRKRQLADSEKRITELDAIFKRLYEDNISGKLSDERFQKLSADYEKEEQELKVLASSLRKEVELEESKSADVDRFLSVVERYTDIPELTSCILHEFVEKIIVHAASDPKGKNRTQEIDIYYKGIGALEMSKVTASMEK